MARVFFGAAAAGGGIAQGAAAQADVLGVDDPAAVDAVFLPQTGIDAVDFLTGHKAGQLRVESMDALHDADAALQVHRFGRIRAFLAGEIVDRQHGLPSAQLTEALPDEGRSMVSGFS